MTTTTMSTPDSDDRKKQVRRMAFGLALLALGFYGAFILMSIYVY